jgi:antirestriction protein
MRDLSNRDDIIDSRDVIARIDELHAIVTDDSATQNERTHANNELSVLQALQDEAEDYCPDWRHGAALVRDSYFTAYAQELCEDIGDIPKDLPSYIEIDWEATARNIRQDYTSVEFDGVTYWVR